MLKTLTIKRPSMIKNSLQHTIQQIVESSLSTKIASIAMLALGCAIANLIFKNEALSYRGSNFLAIIAIIVALFVISLMFKIQWRVGVNLVVTVAVALTSYEQLPQILEPKLGSGLASIVIGGSAPVFLAALTAFLLGKALESNNQRG